MTIYRIFQLLVLTFIFYSISDIFFNEAMLYIVGGLFGTIASFMFGENLHPYVYGGIWLLFLGTAIFLYYVIKNRLLTYFCLFAILVLMYFFDFIILEIATISSYYVQVIISIFLKTILFFLAIYFKRSGKLTT